MNLDISIVIVNYNTAEDVKHCIESVLMQQDIQFEIIVVDNASQDDSVVILKQFGSKIHLIESDKNLGFGQANNLAATQARGKYLFLLNPDALMLAQHDLKKIVQFMNDNKQFGLVGTRIVKANGKDESKPNYAYPGERFIGRPYRGLPGKIAWVLGASIVMPKKIFDKIGGFDSDFFLYGEDPDICLRVRKLGYQVGYFPDVVVKHIGGTSERGTNWYQLTLKKQKALYLFYKKHYSLSAMQFLIRRDIRQARLKIFLTALKKSVTLGLSKRPKDAKYKAIYDLARILK